MISVNIVNVWRWGRATRPSLRHRPAMARTLVARADAVSAKAGAETGATLTGTAEVIVAAEEGAPESRAPDPAW